MNFADRFAEIFRRTLPSPFSIAIILTIITFLLAGFLSRPELPSTEPYVATLFHYWYQGFWDAPLMVFAMQMMLILVLGHILALSKPIEYILNHLTRYCTKTGEAAALVCILTLLVSFFNWGFGLVLGAIFARKVAENALIRGYDINYPIIGAAGYSGLMVWHGGLSGSAPIKVAEKGHFLENELGIISQSETIFSTMNISVSLVLLLLLPLTLYLIGRSSNPLPIIEIKEVHKSPKKKQIGAEKADHSPIFSKAIGGVILAYLAYLIFIVPDEFSAAFINPNLINMLLLGMGLFFYHSIKEFLDAVDSAIGGASGILIQFPLYFGIMGIMKYSGLTIVLSIFFISISNEQTFPFLTMLSAGIINIFVPSGGGQWAVQGPVIAEAVIKLKVLPAKAVMAFAYGDQLTNMLQPFWALPLLGITGLKAKEILPYTIILLLVGIVVFSLGLFLF
ncbi:MAG: short-chain fatty acid transporter [Bacteroidetes bacterium]|nr:short-chain fatty acid transporter [Bacteroidota bacterium]